MSKEEGWENYHCDCGKLLGHFYVGFGWKRPFRWMLMKLITVWKTCVGCMVINSLRLQGRIMTASSPMIKSYLGIPFITDGTLPHGTLAAEGLRGSDKLFYYWDPVYGWIHVSETEKMREAYERFKDGRVFRHGRAFMISTPGGNDHFQKVWEEAKDVR